MTCPGCPEIISINLYSAAWHDRRDRSPASYRKSQQMFRPAVRTTDPGESALRIAAVKILLHDVLDDRPEVAVLPLETVLVLGEKPVEMMEEHPIENRAFRMSRTVDFRHIREKRSRNAPRKNKERIPGIDGGTLGLRGVGSSKKCQHSLTLKACRAKNQKGRLRIWSRRSSRSSGESTEIPASDTIAAARLRTPAASLN